jgi:hypothetical protein
MWNTAGDVSVTDIDNSDGELGASMPLDVAISPVTSLTAAQATVGLRGNAEEAGIGSNLRASPFRDPDLSHKSCAAITNASHAPLSGIDI